MRGATLIETGNALAKLFQSTLPMRGATLLFCANSGMLSISIHTPHAGSDDYSD